MLRKVFKVGCLSFLGIILTIIILVGLFLYKIHRNENMTETIIINKIGLISGIHSTTHRNIIAGIVIFANGKNYIVPSVDASKYGFDLNKLMKYRSPGQVGIITFAPIMPLTNTGYEGRKINIVYKKQSEKHNNVFIIKKLEWL